MKVKILIWLGMGLIIGLILAQIVCAKEIMLFTTTSNKDIQSVSIIESVEVSKDTVIVEIVTTTLIENTIMDVKQDIITLTGENYDSFITNCGIDFDKIEVYIKAVTQN
jgi:esterase/lipase